MKSRKRVVSRALNALVFGSVIAFATFLYKEGLLYVPRPRAYDLLVYSIIFLLVGQVLGTLSWWRVLRLDFDGISPLWTLAGTALSNLGKYLPGKFWVVAGRAAYVSDRSGESLVRLTISSTRSQLVTVWVGITTGLVGALITSAPPESVVTLVLLSGVLFSLIISGVLEWSGSKVHGMLRTGSRPIQELNILNFVRVLPYFLPGPAFRMIGFWLLALSLVDFAPWEVMFAFPLATALGMAAIFAPGGIGVREAVLVGALASMGIDLAEATTIAVTARVWAAVGDITLFGVGVATDRKVRN